MRFTFYWNTLWCHLNWYRWLFLGRMPCRDVGCQVDKNDCDSVRMFRPVYLFVEKQTGLWGAMFTPQGTFWTATIRTTMSHRDRMVCSGLRTTVWSTWDDLFSEFYAWLVLKCVGLMIRRRMDEMYDLSCSNANDSAADHGMLVIFNWAEITQRNPIIERISKEMGSWKATLSIKGNWKILMTKQGLWNVAYHNSIFVCHVQQFPTRKPFLFSEVSFIKNNSWLASELDSVGRPNLSL